MALRFVEPRFVAVPERPLLQWPTPSITDRTMGAYNRGLWASGVSSLQLGRVEGVATRRHKRCFERTRDPRFSSRSTDPSSCLKSSLNSTSR